MPHYGQGFRARLRGELAPAGMEVDALHQALVAWEEAEHDSEGHHTTISASAMAVSGGMSFGGPWLVPSSAVLTPNVITTNQDDYHPPNSETAIVFRLETDAPHDITGLFTDTAVSRWAAFFNVGNFNLVVKHNVSSTLKYRFGCPNGADVTLNSGDGVWLWYDVRSANWRVMGV